MAEVTFEIREHIATLGERNGGWTKEFNLVSWNGGEAKADIREWKDEHSSMKKGITLSRQEFLVLKEAFVSLDEKKITAVSFSKEKEQRHSKS